MKKIHYTAHVRRRMNQRGIREQDVAVTVEHPDSVERTPEPSWRYLRRMSDGRTLKVWVVDRSADPLVVKSAAWHGE